MTPLETKRLRIRNWTDDDRELFHRINSDETVMEFFGFQRTRPQSDELFDRLKTGIEERGYGFWALELKETGACIGFTGLLPATIVPSRPDGCVEIGWRLVPECWGKGYVTEAAEACLAFGFDTLGLAEIVSFAVAANQRSTAVMQRIGMTHDASGDFDHPLVEDNRLKRHVFYTLSAQQWRER